MRRPGDSGRGAVKDRRRWPFCWQERLAIGVIQARWSGRQRATALAIYLAMSHQASVCHDGEHDGFQASRAQIAEAAGTKPATLDTYARDFVQLGLLDIERRTTNRGHDIPSNWVLLSPS